MTNVFQEMRVKLTRIIEFSEAAMTTVANQLIEQQLQGLLPKMTALSDGIWQKTFMDSSKRVRLGKVYVAALSTELGFGLVVWDVAKLRQMQQDQSPRVITNEDIASKLLPLTSCSHAQKAFISLHSVELLQYLQAPIDS